MFHQSLIIDKMRTNCMLHHPLVTSLGILALDLKPGTRYGPKF